MNCWSVPCRTIVLLKFVLEGAPQLSSAMATSMRQMLMCIGTLPSEPKASETTAIAVSAVDHFDTWFILRYMNSVDENLPAFVMSFGTVGGG